jgi:hypothetical protein
MCRLEALAVWARRTPAKLTVGETSID